MNELVYKSARGEVISLTNDDIDVQTATEIRGYEWDCGIGRKNIYSPRRNYIKDKVKFIATKNALEQLRRITDTDVINETQGTFIALNEWKQSGYITGISVEKVSAYYIYGSLECIFLDGSWHKSVEVSFIKNDITSDITNYGMNYPFDYKFDYSNNKTPKILNTDTYLPCEFRMVIYGRCVNPTITLGNNVYRVNVQVPEKALLIIDTRDKTVVLRDETGYEQNVFDKAIRGNGKSSGEYIFEPIPAGEHIISWDNSYGFDIEYFISESSIPWLKTS